MTKRDEVDTAYHEAGHAVAAFFLGLSIGTRGVTVVPTKEEDMLGCAHVPLTLAENPDLPVSGRTA